jgi:pyrroline-5-carboxylate reductase
MNTFGFIGCGNMGGTLALAVSQGVSSPIAVSDYDQAKAAQMAMASGGVALDNDQIAAECRYIFLGVKPQVLGGVLEGLAPILARRTDRFVLVSMAAGVSMETVCRMAGGQYPVIRIMPNTPASVGKGVILYCHTQSVTGDEVTELTEALRMAGDVSPLSESLIDAASAISGCGPAFVYMFIEALADGGVRCGLPRDKAVQVAAETVLGSADMVLTSGRHPGELKDAVCSPMGSTIAGVAALEQHAFRGTVMDAVYASYVRTKELGKKD